MARDRLLGYTIAFAIAFLAADLLYSPHGGWRVHVPNLAVAFLWVGAVFDVSDRHAVWWRRARAAGLTLGLAVGCGMVPVSVKIVLADSHALRNQSLTAAGVGVFAGLLAGVFVLVRAGVTAFFRKGSLR